MLALLAFDAASLSKSGLDDERAWCTMVAYSKLADPFDDEVVAGATPGRYLQFGRELAGNDTYVRRTE